MNCIKNERIKNEIIKNECIKNERIKNELIKKELILSTTQYFVDKQLIWVIDWHAKAFSNPWL